MVIWQRHKKGSSSMQVYSIVALLNYSVRTEENPEIWDEAFTFSLNKNQRLNRKLFFPANTKSITK
jgi:hypothetical protein